MANDPFYSDGRFYDLMHADQVLVPQFYVKMSKNEKVLTILPQFGVLVPRGAIMRALFTLFLIAFFSITAKTQTLQCNAEDIFRRFIKMDLEKNEVFARFAGADPNGPHTWQSVYFGDRFCAMKFDNPETLHCPFTRSQNEDGSMRIALGCEFAKKSELDSPAFGSLDVNLNTGAGQFRCGAQGGTRFNLKLSECQIK